MRNAKCVADLPSIARAAICHHARAANDLEIGNLGQLGQNVVLDAIGKNGVLFIVTQIFERQHSYACRWRGCEIDFPNENAKRHQQRSRRCGGESERWITFDPFFATHEDTSTSRLNWLMPQPALKVFG